MPADLFAPMILDSDTYLVEAVVDDRACPVCRARDGVTVAVLAGGTLEALEPDCDHVKAGTGICRCTYRRVG